MEVMGHQVNHVSTSASFRLIAECRSHSDNKQDPRHADKARIFYICPEWATSTPRNEGLFKNLCAQGKIGRIVVDEAHQALRAPLQHEQNTLAAQRQHRQAYAWVFQIRRDFPDIPFTLVSASTTERDLRTLTDRFGMTGKCIRVAAPLDRPNLYYRVVHVPKSVRNYRIRVIVSYIKCVIVHPFLLPSLNLFYTGVILETVGWCL
jgi:superfamily II DNA helicase RecQ